MLVWKTILSEVNRAQDLLEQWHRYRDSGSCADVLNIQQSKDRLEHLAAELTAGMYCIPTDPQLEVTCDHFEIELVKFKHKVYQDLLKGLRVSNTK